MGDTDTGIYLGTPTVEEAILCMVAINLSISSRSTGHTQLVSPAMSLCILL